MFIPVFWLAILCKESPVGNSRILCSSSQTSGPVETMETSTCGWTDNYSQEIRYRHRCVQVRYGGAKKLLAGYLLMIEQRPSECLTRVEH